MTRPPVPPFTLETARRKVRLAEDAWNSRDPARVALAYTEDNEGKPRYAPGFLDTMLVAVALASAALFLLVEGNYAFAPLLVRVAVVVIGLVFLARAVGDFGSFGFFKRARGTPFARRDTFIYSPLCLALGLGSLWAALGS